MRHGRLIPALASALIALGLPSVASADAGTDYHPNPQARDFTGGAGGWTAEASYRGALCVPGLTCPLLGDAYRGSGGADGGSDGFLETTTGAIANAGVASRVNGTWQSPPFTYNGAGGDPAGKVSLTLDRRSDTGALLDVAGATATYSVEVVDQQSGNAVANPIDGRALNPTDGWTSTDPASVDPARLTAGRAYALRITSQFATTGAEAIPAAVADYDNVVLEASPGSSSGGGGGGGGTGGGGGNGGGNGGGGGVRHLHRLVIKAKCPRWAHARSCLIHLVGLRKGTHGAHVSLPKTVRRRGHHVKRISLRIKDPFRGYAKDLARHHGRLSVHERVAAQHRHHAANRRLRVVAYH